MATIQALIAADKLAEAIKGLKSVEDSNELIILESRLNRLESRVHSGTIGSENADIERNRIRASLLYLAGDINIDIPEEKTKPEAPITKKEESSSKVETMKSGGAATEIAGLNRPDKVPYKDDGKPLFNGKEKTKILFLSANPIDQARLQPGLEKRELKNELRGGSHRDQFEFLESEGAVDLSNLLRAMNKKPNIIHFSGHGLQGGILISTKDNKAQKITTSSLQRLFKKVKDTAKCVILSSCYSAEQAREISKFGMFVIGFNLPVADSAAISFAKGFYNGLGEGNSFQGAYDDALFMWENESSQSIDIIEVWKDGELLDL